MTIKEIQEVLDYIVQGKLTLEEFNTVKDLEEKNNKIDSIEQNSTKLYNSETMPLSSDPEIRMAQERYARGERFLTTLGRDQSKIKKELGNYHCKSNCCYRAISQETYELYKKTGFISDDRPNSKEYMESVDEEGNVFTNNSGIDWYLGGAAPGRKYGMIVIECPADMNYFEPAIDNGSHMTIDPTVRHMKSSPKANPIPFSMITNVFDFNNLNTQNENGHK